MMSQNHNQLSNPMPKHNGSDPHRHLNIHGIYDVYSWPSPYCSEQDISQIEARRYYYGIRGMRKYGPKLIFRTSTDVFRPPVWYDTHTRRVRLLAVDKHSKLSQNNLWDTVRDETAGILDRHHITFTSIDLVRFSWKEGGDDLVTDVMTPATIWIGVLPNSTIASTAFKCSEDISHLLREYGIDDIDIAFRESIVCPFGSSGPILYSPVDDNHPLLSVIDWLTTPPGMPISGLTDDTQGSLGFYFMAGEDLYGVTARHVLFPVKEGNDAYRYDDLASNKNKKKDVVLMSTKTFQDLVQSVEGEIRSFKALIKFDQNKMSTEADGSLLQQIVDEIDEVNAKVVELQKFLETLQKDWSDIENRIIGYVVWSPPISGINSPGPPQGYLRDVCVIKLNKEKFWPNLRGNVTNIGQQLQVGEFICNLYARSIKMVPPGLAYPHLPFPRLYHLKRILPAAEVTQPNILQPEGVPIQRCVSKRGSSTGTTMGRLNGFLSRVRHYTSSGNVDSIETAVLPYDNKEMGTFSQAADSGAAIVGPDNEFVALLTSAAGSDGLCDITYGTPMEWLWEKVIKPEFPDADLFFDVPEED